MFRRKHLSNERISRLCASGSIGRGERLKIARHLSTGCERCLSAVSALAPGSEQISTDPLVEALSRLSRPKSHAMLSADHLAAIAEVRQRPFGFALLLVEEANALAGAHETPRPLEDVLGIIGTLRPRRHRQHYDDLYARVLSYLSTVRTWCHELDAAFVACHFAEGHWQHGTGDERVNATVLEARALFAAADRQHQEAEALLGAALCRLTGSGDHTLRRFELYSRLADVVIGAGEVHRVPLILARARHELAMARESEDPMSREWAIFQQAKLGSRKIL